MAVNVSQCKNLGGGQILANRSQPFLDESSPNFFFGGGHVWEMFRCIDMFSQSSTSVRIKRFLPQPVEVNGPGSSEQIFHIAVTSEYASKLS